MIASAGPDVFRRAVKTLLAAPEVDALIAIVTPVYAELTPGIWTAIEAGLRDARAAGAVQKPIVACVMTEARLECHHDSGFETIPICTFPENAVRALGKAADYGAWRSRPAGLFCAFDDLRPEDARSVCRTALAARGDGWLTTTEIRRVLAAFGIPFVDGGIAKSANDACDIAARVGYPVVAKVASTAVTHKSDLGLVRTNLTDDQALQQAVDELLQRAAELPTGSTEGVLVEPMVSGGLETIVGVTADPSFGRLVAFGMGGTAVEVYADVRFRIAPLTDQDAADLVREPRAARLLNGLRGQAPRDIASVENLLLRVSSLADEIHEISELDLNPVLVRAAGKGSVAVDARIFVRH
jgi:acyl-CoA synthetase (NDP forming)